MCVAIYDENKIQGSISILNPIAFVQLCDNYPDNYYQIHSSRPILTRKGNSTDQF